MEHGQGPEDAHSCLHVSLCPAEITILPRLAGRSSSGGAPAAGPTDTQAIPRPYPGHTHDKGLATYVLNTCRAQVRLELLRREPHLRELLEERTIQGKLPRIELGVPKMVG